MIRILLTAASALAFATTAYAGEASDKAAVKFKQEARATITPDSVKTRDDAARLGEAEFVLADADANAFLTEGEFVKFETMLLKPAGASASISGAPPASMFGLIAGEDSQVSKEELAAARAASFDAADADLNKALSDSERQVFASLIVAPKLEPQIN